MIPDLGKYATAVLGSYAASILLILLLVALSVLRGRRVKRQLAEVEARQGKTNV
ncbi:heme exporter protein CcmD [Pseudotabrizicola sp. L79]|uniref:heme exporter protein CcmD n=1 Tax=Pseudotabrizicola sp. L79 TaxID=3118402 RepID=UPI002F94B132